MGYLAFELTMFFAPWLGELNSSSTAGELLVILTLVSDNKLRSQQEICQLWENGKWS